MTKKGHPVTPLLFIGRPQNPAIAAQAIESLDAQVAARLIRDRQTVYVQDDETAMAVLLLLGATEKHAYDRVHYADGEA